jgi:hypothetical protein
MPLGLLEAIEARGGPRRRAAVGSLDAILVWKLDRWGRSVGDLVATMHELTAGRRVRVPHRGDRSVERRAVPARRKMRK